MIKFGESAGAANWAGVMPIRVRVHNRIVERIGVSVDVDTGDVGVERIGLEEAPERRVVVAGMEVKEAGLVVLALADEGFGLRDERYGLQLLP